MNNTRITELRNPQDLTDAVNKRYMNRYIKNIKTRIIALERQLLDGTKAI